VSTPDYGTKEFTIEYLFECHSRLSQSNTQESLTLFLSIGVWRIGREAKMKFCPWTDEELSRGENDETGYIGTTSGVRCFIQKPWAEVASWSDT